MVSLRGSITLTPNLQTRLDQDPGLIEVLQCHYVAQASKCAERNKIALL